MYGNPVGNVTVELSTGETKSADADGIVRGPFASQGTLKLSDGRRVIFEFTRYRPEPYDPSQIGPVLDDVAYASKNGMYDDDEQET